MGRPAGTITPYLIGLYVKDYEMKAPDYEIIDCALCGAEVLENKLPDHIESVHRDETDRVKEDAHGD